MPLSKTAGNEKQASLSMVRKKSLGVKIFRVFAASVICACIIIGIAGFSLYYFLQGKAEKGSTIVSRVEQSVQGIIGPKYDVNIQTVDLSLSTFGQVILGTNDIVITRKEDGSAISTVGSIEAKMNLLKTISGEVNFNYLTIRDAEFDASLLGPETAYILPPHLDVPLNGLGAWLARLEEKFSKENFDGLEITNAVIRGQILGRLKKDPIKVNTLQVEPGLDKQLILNGKISTELSDITITSDYSPTQNGWRNYNFTAFGVHVGEWLNDPAGENGFFASNGIIDIKGDVPFNPENKAFEPRINLTTSDSQLRLGLRARSAIKSLDLNFRLFLDRNQIELDPSYAEIGRLKAELIGGIKPANNDQGYAGPLLYDLIMKRGLFEPTIEGEKIVPVGIKAAGIYNRDLKQLALEDIIFTTEKGYMSGQAVVGFEGETPSVVGEAQTDGISVAALKQFWPFFIANRARKWVHSHMHDGWITKGSVKANIPPGVIFRLYKGERFTPEQLTVTTDMKDVVFRAFGEMPNITEGSGTVKIEGMKISANLEKGFVDGFGKKDVQIHSGSFVMDDFAKANRIAKASLTLDGDARSVASISDQKPLRVMERMKVVPDQFSGRMHANVVAEFPVGKKISYNDVKWNVLMDLENGKSTKQLAKRKIEKANILIDANPFSATVTGTALVDGVKTRLNLIEPIGKSGKVKRKRTAKTTVSEEDRERLGINLSPVVFGDVDVELTEQDNKQFYKFDLTNAKIEFPWVGWSKGEGIPAKGSLTLKRKKDVFTLSDMKFSGDGFSGEGGLVVSKTGLLSADLRGFKLNEGDDVSLKVEISDGVYNINAAGLSYDARGIINTLIFDSSFKEVQGARSVNLVANFDRIKGFGDRVIENVLMLYESKKGKLQKLDLRGVDRNNKPYNIQAKRSDGRTFFDINSENAGHALAFMNIYSRMRGGKLEAKLIQDDKGPYIGPVRFRNFELVNEPRLAGIVASEGGRAIVTERGERPIKINDNGEKVIKIQLAQSQIERGKGYMNIKDAILRSAQVGMSMNGVLYDANDRMNITGTYMPANSVNLAVSNIPILSQLFSNGRDNALIGVTYQLKGKWENPELLVNPLSVVAPGIFKKVFEFKN